ncbi:hypothetical protein Tco_0504756 [Tanacetum coccineum]
MAELVRLQICDELDDTWAWVALGPERQPDAAAGAPVDARGALDIDEGAQAIPVPTRAPQPPLAAGPVSHPAKAETLGVTLWISSKHNGVNNRESLHAQLNIKDTMCHDNTENKRTASCINEKGVLLIQRQCITAL